MRNRVAAAAVRFIPAALLFGALACSDQSPTSPDRGIAPVNAAKSTLAKTVPSAPQNARAVAGNNTATVSWQAPASNGGSAIKYYQIISNPAYIKTNVSASSTSGTVKGLANGTSYTFTVVAVNGVGQSPPSNVTNAVVPGTTTTTNQPPTATISAPTNNSSYTQGASVTFTGAGSDPEDGALSGTSLVWTSSINGQIGTGASVSTTSLSAGTHTITLTAKDSKGATGTATITVTITAQQTTPPANGRWVTGYYVGYQRSMYPETSVDFTYITHITLGAVEPVNGSGVDTTFYLDNVNGPKMARNLSTRAHQFGRKAILMLGGSSYVSQLRTATNSTNRAAFVSHLLGTMDALGYDGIDVDWEPISSTDEPQALAFLQALRSARPNMIITFPANWVGAGSNADAWFAQVASVVDQLNLMTYEMSGNWGGWVSWHSAALAGQASNRPSSVSSTVAGYRNAGVPAAKLGIGIGTYGSCWQGVNNMNATLSSSANVVASDNVMTYSAIMSQYYNSANYNWDATASMGYLAFSSPTGPQQCTLISYENPQSVTAKGSWAKSQGLGGAIVWSVNEGHLSSAAVGQQDPLLQALYTSIQ